MPRPGEQPPTPSPAALVGLGISLAAAVLIPLVLGLAIDGHFHSSPLGVLGGLLLGIVAACLTVYVRFKRYW